METIVIGVDAVTQPAKVGLCRARWSGRETTLLDPPRCGKAKESIAATLAEWIGQRTATGRRVLLAIDAPLGWPRMLRVALSNHDAGAPLAYSANEMFWRRTDHILKDRFGMQPFSVAADRIARTSHATLRCLEEVRQATGRTLPLVLSPDFEGVGVIEVYPAATLRAHGLWPISPDSLLQELKDRGIHFPDGFDLSAASPHARDAVVCMLAGADFLSDEAFAPSPGDRRAAEVEGWIWVRAP